MNQSTARKRAQEIHKETGRIAIADTYHLTGTGNKVRGGWPSEDEVWAVFDAVTGELIEDGEKDA